MDNTSFDLLCKGLSPDEAKLFRKILKEWCSGDEDSFPVQLALLTRAQWLAAAQMPLILQKSITALEAKLAEHQKQSGAFVKNLATAGDDKIKAFEETVAVHTEAMEKVAAKSRYHLDETEKFAREIRKQMERGFATAYQYNALRQLTNTIAPTNVVIRIAYDPEGNQASATDARGNVTSQSWSATRKLLSATFPAMYAGTPVTTNVYDNRDWLTGTFDPLQNETLYANDPDERLIAQTDPVQRTTTFSYDADSRKKLWCLDGNWCRASFSGSMCH